MGFTAVAEHKPLQSLRAGYEDENPDPYLQ